LRLRLSISPVPHSLPGSRHEAQSLQQGAVLFVKPNRTLLFVKLSSEKN
jgi:hypothetical protein